MNKTIGLVIGAVLIAGAAFAGGWFLSPNGSAPGGPGGPGGFAQLSEAERAQLQGMSDTERQAFFDEKGIEMPAGGPGGPGGPGGQAGQGAPGEAPSGRPNGGPTLLEGVVASTTDDKITVTLTAGGSANAFVDDSTVVASVDGKTAVIEQGAAVLVFTEPEAAGVNAAKAVVIK
jgi:hypothetical protein